MDLSLTELKRTTVLKKVVDEVDQQHGFVRVAIPFANSSGLTIIYVEANSKLCVQSKRIYNYHDLENLHAQLTDALFASWLSHMSI